MYRYAGGAMVRAAVYADAKLPPWPDVTATTGDHVRRWQDWLATVWAVDSVAEAITHASPDLAERVEVLLETTRPDVRRTRRAVMSVMRYLVRMRHRVTPFGLFAGIAPAGFGTSPVVRWGRQHERVASTDLCWVAEVVSRLEAIPQLLERLPVVANNTGMVRGDRLIVPAGPERGETAGADVSLRHTGPVRAALDAARTPHLGAAVAAEVHRRFPHAPDAAASTLVAELVQQNALITALRAPSTITDVLEHLEQQLEAADAGEIAEAAPLLDEIRNARTERERRTRRVGRDGTRQAGTAARSAPVDVRLDAEVVLPQAIAREAQEAAGLLARLSPHPQGDPGWQDYLNRFFTAYGVGALVPVTELVSDAGLGYPPGYPGTSAPPRAGTLSERDQSLARLAQTAAVENLREVDLRGPLGRELIATCQQGPVPPHTELTVRVEAGSLQAITGGDFTLVVQAASRSASTLGGRFLHLLTDDERSEHAQMLQELPTCDPQTRPVQMSFPAPDPASALMVRCPRMLETVLTLGGTSR